MPAAGRASPDLATRLVAVRQHNACTKRRLDEEHATLAEARKRVHRLQAELSAGQQEEEELVTALGGEEAAAAAAEEVEARTAAANGSPEPGPLAAQVTALASPAQQQQQPVQQQPVQQQQAWPQQAVLPPGGVPPGYMLVPLPQQGQVPVVVFHSHGYAPGGAPQQPLTPQQMGQAQAQEAQQQAQQQVQLPQAPYFTSHPANGPADARPPPRVPPQQAAAAPPVAPRDSSGAAPALAAPQRAAFRPFARALQGIGAAPGGSRGPSAGGLSPAGSGSLSVASKEFVPRSVHLHASTAQGSTAQEQAEQQRESDQQQQQQQPATEGATAPAAALAPAAPRLAAAAGPPPGFAAAAAASASAQPAAPSAAGAAVAKGPPPGFAGAAAAPEPRPKPLEASPLAAFPMPGSQPRPPLPAKAAPPLPLQPPPPSQPPQPAAEEQPLPEAEQQQAAAPPAGEPDIAYDEALARALQQASDSDDESLSAAMQQVRMGQPPAGLASANGSSAAGRGWGRGSAAGRQGWAPGAPPPGPAPPADEAAPVVGGSAADFPALGAAPTPAPAAPEPPQQPQGGANGQARGWGSAWGAHSMKAKLPAGEAPARAGGAAGPAHGAQQAPSVEAWEAGMGLRVPGDATPDAQRKRLVKPETFTHEEPALKGGRRTVNMVGGLELHKGVLTPGEQAQVVEEIERWVGLGKAGQLRGRTFSAPRKWLPGKGRMTMQFGCCYNYARDAEGRDPGIIAEEVVEPMPPLLRALCRRLTRWGVLPAAKEPNSAIINIYEAGDCIPPHVDHFDFIRPFCTLSLLSEQSIMFGQRLAPAGPGEFVAQGGDPYFIALPKGSCLVLKGHGGDSAMHCVPPVAARRISITLRKMAPEHEAVVQREAQKLAAAHGGRLPGFWEQDAAGGGAARRGGGAITIK